MWNIIQRRMSIALLGSAVLSSAAIVVLLLPRTTAKAAEQTAPSEIRKLQEERLETLDQAAAKAADLFRNGLGDWITVQTCDQLLLDAKLDMAESPSERINVLQKEADTARQQEAFIATKVNAGLIPQLISLQAKAYRLQVDINFAHETAKADAKPQ